VQAALSEGGSRSIAGGARHWSRRALVIAEVALGVVLLVGAGLLLRTFLNLRHLDPGFNPVNLTTSSVSLQDARYSTTTSVTQFVDQTLERLRARPGVEAASVSLGLPYQRLLNMGARFSDDPPDSGFPTNVSYASPGFFETLGMKVMRGRGLLETDRAGTAPISVVNESFARVLSKGRDPIGRRLRLSGVEREIVGVVHDVQQVRSFMIAGMSDGPLTGMPQVYVPVAQTNDAMIRSAHTWFVPVWTVRDRSQPDGAAAIREAIAAVDPLLPVSQTREMTTVIAASMRLQRLLLTLVGVIAAVALLLAAIGIHGLIAHSVAERRREFGIRLALGASAWRTIGSVALSGLLLAGIGAVLGGLLSVLGVQLVSSFLWGVGDRDPTTYVGVALFLFVVAGIASVVPALRILKLDPAETLRA
jgi:predicted permease